MGTSLTAQEILNEILRRHEHPADIQPLDLELLETELLKLVVDDETQTQRHWSDKQADWCKDVPNRCICEQVNNVRAELRQAIKQFCRRDG